MKTFWKICGWGALAIVLLFAIIAIIASLQRPAGAFNLQEPGGLGEQGGDQCAAQCGYEQEELYVQIRIRQIACQRDLRPHDEDQEHEGQNQRKRTGGNKIAA